jgi:hypothetical protein
MSSISSNTPAENFDRIIDKGSVIPKGEICCPTCDSTNTNTPMYFIASVETALKFIQAVNNIYFCNCCYDVIASIETKLKWNEAYSSISFGEDCVGENENVCPNATKSFLSSIEQMFNSLTSEERDRVLDKGIVEFGSTGTSNLPHLMNFVNTQKELIYNDISTTTEIWDRILDKGFASFCYGDNVYIGSVETVLKAVEALGLSSK